MATPGATTAYAEARIAEGASREHFREAQGLSLSSIGAGTYLGPSDEDADRLYRDALVRCVKLGCNVIDTAINYRCQRSERVVGEALKLLEKKGLDREQVLVASKAGFIPSDDEPVPDMAGYIRSEYIEPGILSLEEIVAGGHCLAPRYLENQLKRSLENLGVETMDIYYLHFPEIQLVELSRDEFHQRLGRAFDYLEKAVAGGQIRFYGAATWDGFRRSPEAPDYLSLEALLEIAREIGGEGHHFRFIQLPYSIAAPEAMTARNQIVEGKTYSALQAANILGISVATSAPLVQGRLPGKLPPWLAGLLTPSSTDAQRAVQFIRSTPGVTSSLIGMKQTAHVEENLALARTAPLALEEFEKLVPPEAAQVYWLYGS